MKKISILIILFCFTTSAYSSLPSSARKTATAGISSSLYDTFDKIVSKPQALPGLKGVEVILFPSTIIDDIYWTSTLISGNRETTLNGVLGFAGGMGMLGWGIYANYYKLNEYSGTPSYNKDLSYTDNDSDGITTETNEIVTTTINSATNFTGGQNIDFGGSIGLKLGGISLGAGVNIYIDKDKNIDSTGFYSKERKKYNTSRYTGTTYLKNESRYNIYQKNHSDILFNFKLYSQRKQPLLLVESKLSIINNKISNNYSYTYTTNRDPNGDISSKYYSKGVTTGSSSTPVNSITNTSGMKLYVNPKFYFPKTDKEKSLSLQGKFGMGLNLKKDVSMKFERIINDYSTTNNANFQDNSIANTTINLSAAGNTTYYLYGFKLTQMFKPKFFKAGIALDTTIEDETTTLEGSYSATSKLEYLTTSSSYTLYSVSKTPAKTITTTDPAHTLSIVSKSTKTTISIPVGVEFKVSEKIKLRSGYTYKYVNSYKETTINDKTTSSRYYSTTDFVNPALTDTTTTNYTSVSEETSKEIKSTSTTYNILSMGIEFALSNLFIINVGGYYDISNSNGKFVADTKIKF